MKRKQPTTLRTQFETDVEKGLSASPKYLSSKYIYDKKGDKLFQQIMNLPEYYLTNCEFNILEKHQDLITQYFKADTGFDFIELGAGDGKKTKILLRNLVQQKLNFKYLPIDISQHILDDLEYSLKTEIPDLEIETLQGTYFKVLENLKSYVTRKKVIIVLGSNIGNLEHQRAVEFLKNIQLAMNPRDMLFMGFDQKKDPQTILDAYNDPQGITAAFNKNLLARINTELGGNFDLDNFKHWETYNPQTGTAKSFLVSTKEQRVFIEAFSKEFNFKPWETIHCEISQKYDNEVVEWLAGEAGLKIKEFFTDDNKYYRNYIFVKK
ncbi:L-histidine N(alpha)-methyltransferase [Haloflavibacter putidus]|uniref:L-histidine N(Alpha)-methyltransferase n=1 Tax=Haloflavibacter putidus TaxID=2576776 RepID=A0A507ZPU6_9FLAO|nr:L-histidine N(alpha)-methyltransferase [Haloflavibacter putidus]TQD39796.1 L-histidine N(alpha)-methyltransferase [Haloflavibacter putidus]